MQLHVFRESERAARATVLEYILCLAACMRLYRARWMHATRRLPASAPRRSTIYFVIESRYGKYKTHRQLVIYDPGFPLSNRYRSRLKRLGVANYLVNRKNKTRGNRTPKSNEKFRWNIGQTCRNRSLAISLLSINIDVRRYQRKMYEYREVEIKHFSLKFYLYEWIQYSWLNNTRKD